jgi:hypothetical protein
MSKVALSGNASGTGTFTIASPNSNTDRTLTLPDSSGTVATTESTLTQFNASGSAPVYAARAWVNFNGTGTVAIRASGNVSSITDNGVGDYTVSFTTAMPDADYSVSGASGAYAQIYFTSFSSPPVLFTTTQCRVSAGGFDTQTVCFQFFR